MKTRVFIRQIALITSLFVFTAFNAAAQPGPGGGRGGVLTEEQRAKIRETMQASQGELTQLNEKLAAAQKEAIKAALADKPDESAVRAKVEAVTKIQADIAMLRFKGVKEIKGTLTDEQKTQLDSRPAIGYMTLFGGLGGFGGGGGGGRRGPRSDGGGAQN